MGLGIGYGLNDVTTDNAHVATDIVIDLLDFAEAHAWESDVQDGEPGCSGCGSLRWRDRPNVGAKAGVHQEWCSTAALFERARAYLRSAESGKKDTT